MLLPLVGFTTGIVLTAVHQFWYWHKNRSGADKWVFLGWMITAWLIGVLLIAGVKFPIPFKQLFPNWK